MSACFKKRKKNTRPGYPNGPGSMKKRVGEKILALQSKKTSRGPAAAAEKEKSNSSQRTAPRKRALEVRGPQTQLTRQFNENSGEKEEQQYFFLLEKEEGQQRSAPIP